MICYYTFTKGMVIKMLKKAFRTAVLAAAVFAASALCGCERDNGENETGYTVISGGTVSVYETTASETEDIYAGVSETELYIPDHMVTKYASLGYGSRMQSAYDDVVDTMLNFRTKSHIPLTISTEDYQKVLETVRCEQLMIMYLENRYSGDFDPITQSYEMNFVYKYSIKQTNIMLMETEAAAKEIMEQISPSMSDYEKLKIFHDYLVLNVESSADSPEGDSVYGALVNKKALCEGYAKAFSYLCNMAGIENMIVTGYTNVAHMWNMVKVEGNWYHVDVGWDKPSDTLSGLYPDMVLYQYFLAGDSVIENNRVISELLCTPPAADSADKYYFNAENRFADSYENALEIIEEGCRKSIDSGEKYFMIKLDSSNLYLQTAADLIKPDENGLSDIDKIAQKLNFKGQISYTDYYKGYRILIFILE